MEEDDLLGEDNSYSPCSILPEGGCVPAYNELESPAILGLQWGSFEAMSSDVVFK